MSCKDKDDNHASHVDNEDDGFPAACTPAALSTSPSTASKKKNQRITSSTTLLPDSQLPFVGGATELQSLQKDQSRMNGESESSGLVGRCTWRGKVSLLANKQRPF